MAKKKNSALSKWQNIAKQGGICQKCLKEKKSLTVDHIVPVAIIEMLDDTGQMRYECEDNFQLLCRPCNRYKAARLDKSNPKTKEVLLSLLQ